MWIRTLYIYIAKDLCISCHCSNCVIGESHWLCISCTSSSAVDILDSMSSMELTPNTILQISKIYKPQTASLEIKKLSVQQQKGSHDCGMFATAFMVEVCKGNDPETVFFNQAKMRAHLQKCFETDLLTPFPRARKSTNFLRSQNQFITIALYCTCRMPDIYDKQMISCDMCEEWFHFTCQKLLKSKRKNFGLAQIVYQSQEKEKKFLYFKTIAGAYKL